jgi:hypothetical protein
MTAQEKATRTHRSDALVRAVIRTVNQDLAPSRYFM